MRTKTVRILNIVAGILLIAAGIYCLCNEDVAVLSAGLMLGIFMLAAGIAEIVVFAGTSGVLIGSGWLLLDGVHFCSFCNSCSISIRLTSRRGLNALSRKVKDRRVFLRRTGENAQRVAFASQ